MRRLARLLLAAALLGAATASAETGPVRATYRIAGEDASLFSSYRNALYRMELAPTPVGEVVAKVEIPEPGSTGSSLLPIDPSQVPAEVLSALDAREIPESVRRLGRRLTVRCRTVDEAQRAILTWIAASIRYDDDRRRPQDSASVLENRAAHCVGMAGLAVDLLRSAGVPARTVSGVWADERPESRRNAAAVPGRAGVYHRWVETFDPARGWFFSDPAGRIDFVSALYLPFAERPERAPANLRVVPITSDGSIPAESVGLDPSGRPIWCLARPSVPATARLGAGSGGAR